MFNICGWRGEILYFFNQNPSSLCIALRGLKVLKSALTLVNWNRDKVKPGGLMSFALCMVKSCWGERLEKKGSLADEEGGEKGRVILYFIFRVKYLPCFGGADFPPPAVAVASVSLLCHYPDRFCFIPLFLPAPFLGGRGNPPTPKPGVFMSEPASASKHSSASKDKFSLGISPGPASLKNGCLFKICGFGANSASIPELLYPQESINPQKRRQKPKEVPSGFSQMPLGWF